MSHKTAATVAHTIGIDTGKNTLHLIGSRRQGCNHFAGKGRSRPDRRTTCKRAAMTKRCPHSGRPAAYKARVVISSRSFGPEPRGRAPERRLPCRGFKQGQLLCLAMSADRLSDRFRQSSQISISVPSSTTCLAGTPKKVAEPLALCCRNAKRVSRQTAMPTTSSLGMIFSRPT